MGTKAEKVYSITSARRALSEDVDDRNMRYLFTMAIRTVCILACALIPHWYRWLFAVGAVILPMLAVLVANAGREPKGTIDEVADARSASTPSAASIPPGDGPLISPDGSLIDTRELVAATPSPPDQDLSETDHTVDQRRRNPEWFSDETEYLR